MAVTPTTLTHRQHPAGIGRPSELRPPEAEIAYAASRWVRAELGPLDPPGWQLYSLEYTSGPDGSAIAVTVADRNGNFGHAKGVGANPLELMRTLIMTALVRAEPIGPGLWVARRTGLVRGYMGTGEIDTTEVTDEVQRGRLELLAHEACEGAVCVRTAHRAYLSLRLGSRGVVAEIEPTAGGWKAMRSWADLVAARTSRA